MAFPSDQRVNIKINEYDDSKTLTGLYNYADSSDNRAPLYCYGNDSHTYLNSVVDNTGEDIYVLLW